MTDSYQQRSINLAEDGGGGGGFNVVRVPFTTMAGAGPNGPVYFLQMGAPADRFGTAAADWTVTPGVPGVSSSTLESATKIGAFWSGQVFLQQGPSAGIPRAFFSAFYHAVGVDGGAQSFQGNNYRSELTLREGGLAVGVQLSFRISWNGNTPLTLNGGDIFVFST